ncbi:alpha-2-HS-glycoprotein-like [Syngnathus scovelli]|uniref:alpha-2-HS-glycoprotein-like n=1 Tax=Syngnathus scovelli TaxID=161590 RepID=UPI00210F5491|nr:alpha-2-HS-glycoprotein-like [Syngnathus scovelli]
MELHLFVLLLWCAGAFHGFLTAATSVTCSKESVAAAAALGVQQINLRQKHGYKFRLQEIQGSNYQEVSGGCHIDVNVKLVQTKCHFTNPKPAEKCDIWEKDERGAVATCSIGFWVMWRVAKVTKYECTTRPEPTNEELATICPDCPQLLPLDHPTALQAVNEAVLKFNRENRYQNHFTLMEVAHVTSGYIYRIGIVTRVQFVLVETMCPRGAQTFAACTPRCPAIATHAFCKTTYYNRQEQLGDLECELYRPQNPTPHPTGVPEPVCRPLFHHSPEAWICRDRLKNPDPSIHHICPFPLGVIKRT